MQKTYLYLCASVLTSLFVLSSCGSDSTPQNQQPFFPIYEDLNSALVVCNNNSASSNTCYISQGTIRSASIFTETSGPCILGNSWSYDSNSITVYNNCSATFNVRGSNIIVPVQYQPGPAYPNYPTVNGSQLTKVIECNPDNNHGIYPCAFREGSIVIADMIRQLSDSSCAVRNVDWGYNRHSVWVARGCRAKFRVTYTPR